MTICKHFGVRETSNKKIRSMFMNPKWNKEILSTHNENGPFQFSNLL